MKKFNVEGIQYKKIGAISWKIGKQIVLDGAKALALKGAKVTIESMFSGQSMKSISLDDVLSGTLTNKKLSNKEGNGESTTDNSTEGTNFDKELLNGGLRAVD